MPFNMRYTVGFVLTDEIGIVLWFVKKYKLLLI